MTKAKIKFYLSCDDLGYRITRWENLENDYIRPSWWQSTGAPNLPLKARTRSEAMTELELTFPFTENVIVMERVP